ncbi:ABC transporter substrate-binding protein [Actinotalea sp.]|uniref:ABC transporter substrate-binding protein n=1 Tax=Actinotalea sp. TaxID=1872145 RepID=UPI002C691766|nr:ABC transporter substrate-binding protein [Actinotalea sp.]HRA51654.1 ABC transporter substrate-binding protein [Actinotalea sp.]
MRRRLLPLVAAVGVLGLLAGCGGTTTAEPATSATAEATVEPAEAPAEPTTIRIASLKGPTTMGLVGLMADAAAGETAEDYQVTMYGTPDEIVPLVVQGGVDVALVPANLAAVLYARTLDADGAQVQVAAINTLGMLEVLEAGDTVHSVADLAGRTVYSTGKGASPEYVLNYLLASNGLDPATDVTVEFKSEATEVAALLAAEPGAVGVLPQPYVTVLQTQNPAIRTALSLSDEWAAVTPDSQMVTGVVVVRTAFLAEHPEAFETFLDDYEASTEFTNEHPAEAATLIAEAGIVPAAPIAEAAIPACNITFIDGDELRTVLGGYLQVLADADPAAVGGSVPGDDFYYRR